MDGAEIVDRHVIHRIEEKPNEIQDAVVNVQTDTAFALKVQENLWVEAH